MTKTLLFKLSIALNVVLLVGIFFLFTADTRQEDVRGTEKKVSQTSKSVKQEKTLVENTWMVERTNHPLYLNRTSAFANFPVNEQSIVMLGDSITQRNEWAEAFGNPHVVNRGIDGDTVYGVLKRIEGVLAHHPDKIFLNIGINDLSYGNDPETVHAYYEELVNLVKERSPGTKLHLLSIFPVNNTVYEREIDNRDVQAFNERLKQLADRNGLPFIEIYSKLLKEGTNELDEAYSYDGLHPNGFGYSVIIEQLSPYLAR